MGCCHGTVSTRRTLSSFPVICTNVLVVFVIAVLFYFLNVGLNYLYFIDKNHQFVSLPPVTSRSNGKAFFSETIRSFKLRKAKEFSLRRAHDRLSDEEKEGISRTYHRNVTIQWVERSLLPDTKEIADEQCLGYLHGNYGNFTVSIVITFQDELIALIFRTLSCIIARTQKRFLKEIVLVDDGSGTDDSKELERLIQPWLSQLSVRLHRSPRKLGITDARRWGIELASSDIVVILDSHMEVADGWLEPLLSILYERQRAVAVPCIHMISEDAYEDAAHRVHPYTISLVHGYGTLTFDDIDPKVPDILLPFHSAGLAGGALGGFRSFLLETYPRSILGRSSWGVENSRLAVRSWLCGDGVWVSCCSQVTHPNGNDPGLYRYLNQSGQGMFENLKLESAAEILNFISSRRDRERFLHKVTGEPGIIQELSRKIYESYLPKAPCRDYMWYLQHIHPYNIHLDSSDSAWAGEVQSVPFPGTCLENIVTKKQRVVSSYYCRRVFLYEDTHTVGFLLLNRVQTPFNMCWVFNGTESVFLERCDIPRDETDDVASPQRIYYNNSSKQIIHAPSDRCVSVGPYLGSGRRGVLWERCNSSNARQHWNIKTAPWF